MYWNSILWLLTWPALVIITYQLVKFVIIKYEPILEKPVKKVILKRK